MAVRRVVGALRGIGNLAANYVRRGLTAGKERFRHMRNAYLVSPAYRRRIALSAAVLGVTGGIQLATRKRKRKKR